MKWLRRMHVQDVLVSTWGRDAMAVYDRSSRIVSDVRQNGEPALRRYALEFGDLKEGDPLIATRSDLEAALAALPIAQYDVLARVADRIRAFAQSQRACLSDLDVAVPGGRAGHVNVPVESAGCYAPGGRFPLPSSVLMTAITARVAGVRTVWVASPRPTTVTLAAAALAGADSLLAVGGAQAIGALAYGAGAIPACDVIVGPGNRWVTAAKKHVAGDVGIDMLAGPSELVVLADNTADPVWIAADLLAQAEHDPHALPVLVAHSEAFADAVNRQIDKQLGTLPTRAIAQTALANGFYVVADTIDAAIDVCNRLAPEHLELHLEDPVVPQLAHYGALFIGKNSSETMGDYGIGPNHVLPTGRGSRFAGGLSVLNFLRTRTWLRLDGAANDDALRDAIALARIEGLEAHARAAECRLRPTKGPL